MKRTNKLFKNKLTSFILAISIIFGITPKSANCDFAISQIFSRLFGKNSSINAKTFYGVSALASTVAIASNIVQFYNLKNNVTGQQKQLPFYLDNTSNLMLSVINKNVFSLPFNALFLLASSIPAIPQMILGKKKTKTYSNWLYKNISTPIVKCFGSIFLKTGNYILGDGFEEGLSIAATITPFESFMNLIRPDRIKALVLIITKIEELLQKSNKLDKESDEYKKHNQACLDLFAKFNTLLGSPLTDLPEATVGEIAVKIGQLKKESDSDKKMLIIKDIKHILIDAKVALKLSAIIDKHANILIDAQKELGLIAREIETILQNAKDLDKQSEKYSEDYKNLENSLGQNYKKFETLLNSPYCAPFDGIKTFVNNKLQELEALNKTEQNINPEDISSPEQLAAKEAVKLDAQIQIFSELKDTLIPASEQICQENESPEENFSYKSVTNKLYSLMSTNFKFPTKTGKEINQELKKINNLQVNIEQDYCKKLEILDEIDDILTKTKKKIDKQELVKNIQAAGTSIGSNVSKFFSIYGPSTIWHSGWILYYMFKINKLSKI